MSIVIIFGAGASCDDGCVPRRPPLSNELFDELVRFSPSWGAIDPARARAFRESFEQGMASLYDHHKGDFGALQDLVDGMAAYFSRFQVLPRHPYIHFGARLNESLRRIVFVSLNYETLLEQAIDLTGSRFYDRANDTNWTFTDEVEPRAESLSRISVIKPHGSSNYLSRGGLLHRVTMLRGSGGGFGFTSVVSPDAARKHFAEGGNGGTMSLFEPLKESPTGGFLREELDRFYRGEIRCASRIAVIGARLQSTDAHLWGPVAATRIPMTYVAPDKTSCDVASEWAEQNRVPIRTIQTTFRKAIPQLLDLLR